LFCGDGGDDAFSLVARIEAATHWAGVPKMDESCVKQTGNRDKIRVEAVATDDVRQSLFRNPIALSEGG